MKGRPRFRAVEFPLGVTVMFGNPFIVRAGERGISVTQLSRGHAVEKIVATSAWKNDEQFGAWFEVFSAKVEMAVRLVKLLKLTR